MKNMTNLIMDDEELEMATPQEMQDEAMRRLCMMCESFGLNPKIVENWKSGYVTCFSTTECAELTFACGRCYFDLPDGAKAVTASRIAKRSQFAKIIHKYERAHGGMVYLALKNGPFLTLLYVSPYKVDWEIFHELEFPDAHFSAYVHNFQFPECSESGDVCLCAAQGLLVRIA
jgi:hypothetical protein